MNNKILIVCICFLLVLCGCNNNEQQFDAKIGEIQELKESTKEIPKFVMTIQGLKNVVVTEEDIKNIKLYDFIADVTAYDIDPDSDIYHEKWTGVKLSDVLNLKDIKEYDTLDFKATGNLTVRYKKDEIDDSIYLVFYRNDVLLSETEETPIMLFAAKLKNRFWVPSLVRIEVM